MKGINIVIILSIALLILCGLGLTSIVAIDAGYVGVHDLFGVVDDNEMQPGLHLKNPFAHVTQMSVKTQEYTMTFTEGEGAKYQSDIITALTKEGLSVDLDITILFKLSPSYASEVYKTIGTNYVSVIVRPQIRTVIRETVAKYEAKQLYSEDRQAIAIELSQYLEPELYERGIILEQVLLRHIQLPNQLTTSIEQKLVAEQEAERMQFILQKETQEADRKLIEATGIKNAMEAIKTELTPAYNQYLAIKAMEDLVNSPNTVFYFIPTSSEGMGIPLVLQAQE